MRLDAYKRTCGVQTVALTLLWKYGHERQHCTNWSLHGIKDFIHIFFYFNKLILSLKRNIQRPRTTWPGTKFDFLMETRYTSSTVLFWVTYSCLKIDLMQFSFQLCLQKYRVIFWYLCRSVWKCLSLIHPGRACLRRSVFCGTKENLEGNKQKNKRTYFCFECEEVIVLRASAKVGLKTGV